MSIEEIHWVTCTHVWARAPVRAHMHTDTNMHTHTRMCPHNTHAHTHAHASTRTQTYMHAHAHAASTHAPIGGSTVLRACTHRERGRDRQMAGGDREGPRGKARD
jgi:hypothetical protein